MYRLLRMTDNGPVLVAECADVQEAAKIYEADKTEHEAAGYLIERGEDDDSVAE